MRNYKVVLYPIRCDDNTVSQSARFPAVDGCVGGGDTPDEAIKEAFENLDVHLKVMEEEGKTIPKEDEQYSGKFALRMSKSLHEKATMYAEHQGVSLNAFINETLSARIGQDFAGTF